MYHLLQQLISTVCVYISRLPSLNGVGPRRDTNRPIFVLKIPMDINKLITPPSAFTVQGQTVGIRPIALGPECGRRVWISGRIRRSYVQSGQPHYSLIGLSCLVLKSFDPPRLFTLFAVAG